jgi:hypothetical protein
MIRGWANHEFASAKCGAKQNSSWLLAEQKTAKKQILRSALVVLWDDIWCRWNWCLSELRGEFMDIKQVELIEKLGGEQGFAFHYSSCSCEDPSSSGHSHHTITIWCIWALNWDMAMFSKVGTELAFIAVSIKFRNVLNHDAHPCCDTQSFLQRAIIQLVGVREKVTKALHSLPSCIGVVGVDKKLGALSVQVVDLIYT